MASYALGFILNGFWIQASERSFEICSAFEQVVAIFWTRNFKKADTRFPFFFEFFFFEFFFFEFSSSDVHRRVFTFGRSSSSFHLRLFIETPELKMDFNNYLLRAGLTLGPFDYAQKKFMISSRRIVYQRITLLMTLICVFKILMIMIDQDLILVLNEGYIVSNSAGKCKFIISTRLIFRICFAFHFTVHFCRPFLVSSFFNLKISFSSSLAPLRADFSLDFF